MIIEQSQHIIDEVSKVFIGKDEIIKKVLMTIYAGGHILLNDAPGTGKTTLALAFSKALGLDYKRIQFTTDTLPSDIVGFTMLNNETQKFEFRPGAVFSNLLLADEINRTSPKTQAALIVRIKILSNMDIAEKRLPQDGHFMGVIDGVELNIRVSVIPTIFGEKIVMRYLNSNSTIDRLSTFGMTEENFKKMNHMMSMPHGIIYVTGPTGSGKTTTLYMILEKLAQGQINISTIEDPVERKLNRINQMQVNTMSGLTFDRGLRALMRQDPDVIMVGETRDKETAEISVRAAITGHLVVSTLHTNDAISTIVRLEEMGVEPYMVANSLVGVVAQRLMRKVCPYCKKEVATSLSDRLALQEGIKYISKGTGCPHCNQTGYKGRIAIHEVIEIDSKVRKMISNQEEIDDIMKYLVEEQGVETLRDQALKLVKEGKTTVDEFNKIIAYID